MSTPKRTPIERVTLKGTGDLRRKNQLSSNAQPGIFKRTTKKLS
ncbi:hypothetical protein [Dehalococcoides mccartyi]|uniref:Uncharacterized protein n=1 Tax=Dehalococcoides mccartyi TaxID=61435 RepID=A0A328ERP4_9CHLR|nr:hypothetical protein [Dehalococcoides mccartyi]MBA2084521.1 hypothetical protein [Dehalococcoides mccartyi]RAL68809.1 hypothetical protein C1G87_1572 [Dehalococcoides mccartyi]RAL70011.1 hypothetical protein C1G86_1535 [Dehalococcoides mccartyi]BCT55361.1 hypothetical protein DHCNIT_0001240 [Dehalococcoides mccartyi]